MKKLLQHLVFIVYRYNVLNRYNRMRPYLNAINLTTTLIVFQIAIVLTLLENFVLIPARIVGGGGTGLLVILVLPLPCYFLLHGITTEDGMKQRLKSRRAETHNYAKPYYLLVGYTIFSALLVIVLGVRLK